MGVLMWEGMDVLMWEGMDVLKWGMLAKKLSIK